ncbi:3-keto-5-aminohexanoate cleavage protein [Paenibacillus mucilaginosus]|uniref:3-keto-5-aminohexanoate cleavage protein n=1 Tax=Paenibacillus mucilaginosus TaxID=61624 RepID=UPI0005A08F8A|nr:3-keto-5-aminohexanoate cleavage protein [Paenibacillus mucilaginosus]MCG7212572.1 3-keto-5-aminohexanoate cleavage protein [Paenibacillus mucilaginosus]WDM25400.1 3-keto-5-aminohexanoate cleavage protein [Paenibacillus mucilaginosus]
MKNPHTHVQVCLNGRTTRLMHPAVPLTARELAADARRCATLGVQSLHAHARLHDEAETLEPAACAGVVRAIRAVCPRTPIGLTTSLSAEPDPAKRLHLVSRWEVLPDFVSVNFCEPGTAELCRLLRERGIPVEAGLATLEDADAFLCSGFEDACIRVLVEVCDRGEAEAASRARAIAGMLQEAGITLPQVHHGEGPATWAVLRQAVRLGHGIRIGLEDTCTGPHGSPVPDGNAELAAAALELE